MGDLDLFFQVTEDNKGKSLSSRYLHTYYLYYFRINTSDSYDGNQGQLSVKMGDIYLFFKVTG